MVTTRSFWAAVRRDWPSALARREPISTTCSIRCQGISGFGVARARSAMRDQRERGLERQQGEKTAACSTGTFQHIKPKSRRYLMSGSHASEVVVQRRRYKGPCSLYLPKRHEVSWLHSRIRQLGTSVCQTITCTTITQEPPHQGCTRPLCGRDAIQQFNQAAGPCP